MKEVTIKGAPDSISLTNSEFDRLLEKLPEKGFYTLHRLGITVFKGTIVFARPMYGIPGMLRFVKTDVPGYDFFTKYLSVNDDTLYLVSEGSEELIPVLKDKIKEKIDRSLNEDEYYKVEDSKKIDEDRHLFGLTHNDKEQKRIGN